MRALNDRDTSVAKTTATIPMFSSRPAALNAGCGVVDGEPGEPSGDDPTATPLEADRPCMISCLYYLAAVYHAYTLHTQIQAHACMCGLDGGKTVSLPH